MATLKWFKEVKTVEELKKEFKKLVFKWHPDVTKKDTTAEMASINSEYELLFKKLPKSETDQRFSTDKDMNDGFREVLEKIINLPDLDIEICGTWVWVGGQTFKAKDPLVKAGFNFAPKKKLWYWRAEENRVFNNRKNVPMEQIRILYGSEKVNSKQTEKLDK